MRRLADGFARRYGGSAVGLVPFSGGRSVLATPVGVVVACAFAPSVLDEVRSWCAKRDRSSREFVGRFLPWVLVPSAIATCAGATVVLRAYNLCDVGVNASANLLGFAVTAPVLLLAHVTLLAVGLSVTGWLAHLSGRGSCRRWRSASRRSPPCRGRTSHWPACRYRMRSVRLVSPRGGLTGFCQALTSIPERPTPVA